MSTYDPTNLYLVTVIPERGPDSAPKTYMAYYDPPQDAFYSLDRMMRWGDHLNWATGPGEGVVAAKGVPLNAIVLDPLDPIVETFALEWHQEATPGGIVEEMAEEIARQVAETMPEPTEWLTAVADDRSSTWVRVAMTPRGAWTNQAGEWSTWSAMVNPRLAAL